MPSPGPGRRHFLWLKVRIKCCYACRSCSHLCLNQRLYIILLLSSERRLARSPEPPPRRALGSASLLGDADWAGGRKAGQTTQQMSPGLPSLNCLHTLDSRILARLLQRCTSAQCVCIMASANRLPPSSPVHCILSSHVLFD